MLSLLLHSFVPLRSQPGSPPTWAFPPTFKLPSEQLVREIPNVADTKTIKHILHDTECSFLIDTFESLGFERVMTEKNRHQSLQCIINEDLHDKIFGRLKPHIPLYLPENEFHDAGLLVGLNRRVRVYKYVGHDDAQAEPDQFLPHIDAGWPEGGERDGEVVIDMNSADGKDSNGKDTKTVVGGRFSCLLYLSENFSGGQTTFYSQDNGEEIASVKPSLGTALIFPQALGEAEMKHAIKTCWPTHAGCTLSGGTKIVIRTDVLYSHKETTEKNRHDYAIHDMFSPLKSSLLTPEFMALANTLYTPVMGTENLAPFLHSLIRFVKPVRDIVEVGGGYSSLWILLALRENQEEIERIREGAMRGEAKMLDYPWTVGLEDRDDRNPPSTAKLRVIDNCLHQMSTASKLSSISQTLCLSDHLVFSEGDAWDFSGTFPISSVSLFFVDFGAGSRLGEFIADNWAALDDGGFLVVHSSVTNERTRKWLEGARAGGGGDTGLPVGEFHHVSLLEPHKRFQNAVTILQKRGKGGDWKEPLYSVYG